MKSVAAFLVAVLLCGCSGPDLSYEARKFTSDFAYDEVCGGGWGGGFLIDFDPSWEDVVSFLPDHTRSIWEIPGGFVASDRSDSVTRDSIVARFRLDEGRVDAVTCASP